MAPTPAVDPNAANAAQQILTALSDLRKDVETKHITVERFQGELKGLEDKLAASFKATHEAHDVEMKRLIAERTARIPGVAAPGAVEPELRSLGQRFAETPEFKAYAADHGGRAARFSATLAARTRTMEQRAITEAGSGLKIPALRLAPVTPMVTPLVIRDLFTQVGLSGTNSIEYAVETWTNAADYQLTEGAKKAESSVAWVEKTVNVRTIAHFIKASKQFIADVPYFSSIVDEQLLLGIAKKEDVELLWGDNSAGKLWGVMPQATALPAGLLVNATPFAVDYMLSAIAYLGNIGFRASAIVLNPIDWASMQVQKTSQGIYVLGGPPAANAAQTLWGVPVVTSNAMTADNFLVGAFPGNATLFDREQASVEIAYENEDDFVKNLVTIRAEERIALAVFRPTAFIKGDVTPALALADGGSETRVSKGK